MHDLQQEKKLDLEYFNSINNAVIQLKKIQRNEILCKLLNIVILKLLV